MEEDKAGAASDPKKDLDGEQKGLDRDVDTLERDFQEVLQELATDSGLDKFRVEYEKVFRALKKSHENEKRLIKKCRELNTEIVSAAAKVQSALKLSEDDQITITALKKEIENSWKMVDDSHSKELKAKEQMAELKVEIGNLTRLLEEGAAVGLTEEKDLEELVKQKEQLTRERDSQVEQIVSLRNEVTEFQDKLRLAELEKSNLEGEIQQLRDQMAQRKAEADKELKRKERLEKEMRDLRASLEARQQEIRDKQLAVQQSSEHVAKLQGMLRETQLANERVQKDFNALTDKVYKLQRTLEEHVQTNSQLMAENSQRQLEIKAREDEIRVLKDEAAKAAKVREHTMMRLQQLEKQKGSIEVARDDLRSQVAGLEREIQLAQRQIDIERSKQEELVRERERLNKARTTAENNTAKHADLVKVTEMMKKNLESEITSYRGELARQEQTIRALEREKDRFVLEANNTANKFQQAQQELELRDAAITELQKRIAEGETKLKQQQELYEVVRAERNTHSRNLIELQDEIHELRRKLQMLNHQADQLKQEISNKDTSLMKVKYDHIKAEKDCEALRSEINRITVQVKEQETSLSSHAATIHQLQNVIAEADQDRLRLKKEYDVVVGERDVLGTQLVRRNEELRLLYEKIKIQQSTLQKGQAQYRDRMNEIRVLKIKVNNLKRELQQLRSTVANSDILKREVHHLNRELLQERTKVKALSEELENPLNVHRWRKLEGSDPTSYEMILKIQMLQKRLIAKTEEVVEKDLLIQEKEKLYLELKGILARQPGPEAAEQLSLYQASLREKTKQLKALASELNMYQAQVAEYKYEIERLQGEMNEVKRKYFEQKKQQLAEQQSQQQASSKTVSGKDSGVLPPLPSSPSASKAAIGGGSAVSLSVQAF